MAEAQYGELVEEPPETIDDDTLPDGVDPVKGLKIFENLNEGNLADQLEKLDDFSVEEVLRLLDEAEESMGKWKKRYKKALDLSKLQPETEKKTFPFENASTVMLPFLLEAMLDFHSRTVAELVWTKDVVNVKTYGTQTKEKKARAVRVSDYLNYQVSESIPFWRSEQDKMLLQLPCVGTAYKKTYFNSDEQEARSDLFMADEVIFCHDYRTFDEAPDKFLRPEYTRNEVLGYIRGAMEWDLAEEDLPTDAEDPDNFEFVRAYTWADLDEDGLCEPYEIIIYKKTDKVVACYPAYDEEGISANKDGEIIKVEMCDIFTQYRFLPDPECGPMGMGWGILLCDTFDALNTSVRQAIDAGTLANLAGNSGLIDAQMSGGSGRGNRQQSGPIEVRMGELTPVTTGGKTLEQSITQFPYRGPNPTLFQLTDWLLQQIRGMTSSALNIDTNNQEAAVMYLARLQQALKVPNSIVMRVYDCAREEFTKLAALNFKHYSDEKYNRVLDDDEERSMRQDFNPEDCDIRLATDPSQGSDIERQQRASIILEEAKTQPQPILNLREAYLDWLRTLKVADLEAMAPEPTGEPDPMEELMRANMARQAELEDRRMTIDEAELELKRMEAMMKGQKEAAEMGLKLDTAEADIAAKYAAAFKALWEIGMAGPDPVRTVQNMERRLIENRGAPPPPKPLDSPNPNPTTGVN